MKSTWSVHGVKKIIIIKSGRGFIQSFQCNSIVFFVLFCLFFAVDYGPRRDLNRGEDEGCVLCKRCCEISVRAALGSFDEPR